MFVVCRGLTTYDFIVLEQKRQREKAAGVGGNNAQSSNVNDSDSGDDDADGTSCREEEGGIATSHEEGREGREEEDRGSSDDELKQEQHQIQHQERKEFQQRLLLKRYDEQQIDFQNEEPSDLENNNIGNSVRKNQNGTHVYVQPSKEEHEQESDDSVIELYPFQQEQQKQQQQQQQEIRTDDVNNAKVPTRHNVPHQIPHPSSQGKWANYDPIPKVVPRSHNNTFGQCAVTGPVEFYAEQFSSDDNSTDLNPADQSWEKRKEKKNSFVSTDTFSENDRNKVATERVIADDASISLQDSQGKGVRGSHSAWERNGLVEENGDTRTTYTSSQPSGILHSPSLETQLRRKEVEKEVVNEKEVKQRQQKLAGTLAFSRSETAMSNVSA